MGIPAGSPIPFFMSSADGLMGVVGLHPNTHRGRQGLAFQTRSSVQSAMSMGWWSSQAFPKGRRIGFGLDQQATQRSDGSAGSQARGRQQT